MQVKLSKMPKASPTYVVDFPKLDGGLNIRELNYRLEPNQSPDMKNLWWQDGVLQCRDGQRYLDDSTSRGAGYTCAEMLYHNRAFFHIGTKIYAATIHEDPDETSFADVPPPAGIVTTPFGFGLVALASDVPENRGTFFLYDDALFYKNHGGFVKITYRETPEYLWDPILQHFSVENVTDLADAHPPVILLNADPEEAGAGDLYQPENRLTARKEVHYNAKENSGTAVDHYKLPVDDIDVMFPADESVTGSYDRYLIVRVDGTELEEGSGSSLPKDYYWDAENHVVVFTVAPPVTDPATNNTVEIVYAKANLEALSAVMDCVYATVAGDGDNLCILLGGCTAQPNAVFWNANDDLSMNAAYFPMTNYNLCAGASEAVTGFGKQYDDLILFKENSVGKLKLSIEKVENRDSISFSYQTINANIGCDLPWTIRLVENNLVFCNTHRGVYLLQSSSAALENNVVCISENVNGERDRGLLHDVRITGLAGRRGATYYSDISRTHPAGTLSEPTPIEQLFPAYGRLKVSGATYYVGRADIYDAVSVSVDDGGRYWLCAAGHVYAWDYEISSVQKPSWFYFDNILPAAFLIDSETDVYHLDPFGRVTIFERSFSDYSHTETVDGNTVEVDDPIDKIYTFPTQTFGTYERLKDVVGILITVRSDTDTDVQIRYDTEYESRLDLTPIRNFSYRLTPRNLAWRSLITYRYGHTARRDPKCRHIRHFSMTLANNIAKEDLSIVSAQILYRYAGEER